MTYGTGTRSYNRSTEARESKRQQREVTERYLNQPKRQVLLNSIWLVCRCMGSPQPHQAHSLSEVLNFRPWFRWRHNGAK
jgi:hypothetical protein